MLIRWFRHVILVVGSMGVSFVKITFKIGENMSKFLIDPDMLRAQELGSVKIGLIRYFQQIDPQVIF